MSTQTTGSFIVASWDESVVGDAERYPKLAHAAITNTFSGGIEAAEVRCEYTLVYRTELTGSFTGMQLLSGTISGRKGSFAVEERGWFGADGLIHGTFEVVAGSATDELSGLSGTGRYTTKHGESAVPYTFDYDLD
ncbi:DUF3224 domain-containing protein [Saccharopolyspora sp. K220]|uniref:DUF3224 domain-containing protein n=1 Tax=Saccharopolyspora soli TaxID=2926618 RepID=UPI001F5A3AE3|nr:DUF3224 domain-containing protein [Saccharopolyspora soli]MCI2418867.1 DUF3224 domain-containing protein [Saccharopolyspora soli]